MRGMPQTVYLILYMCSTFIVLPSTMNQFSSSVYYFRSPVQLPPYAKCEDIICRLLFFCLKDMVTGRKRQEG